MPTHPTPLYIPERAESVKTQNRGKVPGRQTLFQTPSATDFLPWAPAGLTKWRCRSSATITRQIYRLNQRFGMRRMCSVFYPTQAGEQGAAVLLPATGTLTSRRRVTIPAGVRGACSQAPPVWCALSRSRRAQARPQRPYRHRHPRCQRASDPSEPAPTQTRWRRAR